jgi:hypothetical protein
MGLYPGLNTQMLDYMLDTLHDLSQQTANKTGF